MFKHEAAKKLTVNMNLFHSLDICKCLIFVIFVSATCFIYHLIVVTQNKHCRYCTVFTLTDNRFRYFVKVSINS